MNAINAKRFEFWRSLGKGSYNFIHCPLSLRDIEVDQVTFYQLWTFQALGIPRFGWRIFVITVNVFPMVPGAKTFRITG